MNMYVSTRTRVVIPFYHACGTRPITPTSRRLWQGFPKTHWVATVADQQTDFFLKDSVPINKMERDQERYFLYTMTFTHMKSQIYTNTYTHTPNTYTYIRKQINKR